MLIIIINEMASGSFTGIHGILLKDFINNLGLAYKAVGFLYCSDGALGEKTPSFFEKGQRMACTEPQG